MKEQISVAKPSLYIYIYIHIYIYGFVLFCFMAYPYLPNPSART